jgi:hypothetical protein
MLLDPVCLLHKGWLVVWLRVRQVWNCSGGLHTEFEFHQDDEGAQPSERRWLNMLLLLNALPFFVWTSTVCSWRQCRLSSLSSGSYLLETDAFVIKPADNLISSYIIKSEVSLVHQPITECVNITRAHVVDWDRLHRRLLLACCIMAACYPPVARHCLRTKLTKHAL